MLHSLSTAALLASSLVSSAAALSSITAVGSKFFTSDGKQWYIKGIAYQLSTHDPLINTDQCQRDAESMAALGANAIRVYHVDPSGDHKGCMDAFAKVGIYLFVDLDTFDTQIDKFNPHWNETQFDHFASVLDEFQNYDNTAGVFIGNEILAEATQSSLAVYAKAAARDLKAYRDKKKYRKIPIGYSAADIAELRPMLQDYLVCGGNASEAIDFFSLNAYEWCSSSDTFQTSGYSTLQDQANGYPVPIFFSETGCNVAPPRSFKDQATIFGSNMVNTWSGAIIYEWVQEANKYGLVTYGSGSGDGDAGDGIARSGTPTPISPDYNNLKTVWAAVSPTGVALSDYTASTASLSTPACPTSSAGGWQLNGNPSIPVVGQAFTQTATAAHSQGTAPVHLANHTTSILSHSTSVGTSGTSSSVSGGPSASPSHSSNSASAMSSSIPLMSAGGAKLTLVSTVTFTTLVLAISVML